MAAHRFILGARSQFYERMLSTPMQEAWTRNIPISTPLQPRIAAVKALLLFLYTGRLAETIDDEVVTSCDLVDLLSMAGPGGQNYLQLSEPAWAALRLEALRRIKASLQGSTAWSLLRRSTAQHNQAVKSLALAAVLRSCASGCHDADSFRKESAPTEEWWTPKMENELLLELLHLKCTEGEHKTWDLELHHAAREDDSVQNHSGNKYLLQDFTNRGSACISRSGDWCHIVASFASHVHVDFVMVAPLEGWGPRSLKGAELQVMHLGEFQ